jgi:hypothetical protein
MEMADFTPSQHQFITAALSAELSRQGVDAMAAVDVEALAEAVEHAISVAPTPSEEGKRPDELNAGNDG